MPATKLLTTLPSQTSTTAKPESHPDMRQVVPASKRRTLTELPGEIVTMIVSFVVDADFNNENATINAPQTRGLLQTSSLLRRIAVHEYWLAFLRIRVISSWSCDIAGDYRVHEWFWGNYEVQCERLWRSPFVPLRQKWEFRRAARRGNRSLLPWQWRPWLRDYDEPSNSPVMAFSCWNAPLAEAAGIEYGGYGAGERDVFRVCNILDYLWPQQPDDAGNSEYPHRAGSVVLFLLMMNKAVEGRLENRARNAEQQEEEEEELCFSYSDSSLLTHRNTPYPL